MSRAARLLELLQLLRRHRMPVTGHAIATELGVSLRTVYRDIVTLQSQGATIEGEAGLGFVLRPGVFLPPLMFKPGEVEALILGLRLVVARGDEDLGAAADQALARIEAVLPPSLADARATTGLLAGPGKAPKSPHLSMLRRAMATEQRLRLSYEDKGGRATDRIVWPVAIGFFDGAEVVAAWCELRSDFRHFRLDRIRAAAPTGDRFPRRHRALLAAWRTHQNLGALF